MILVWLEEVGVMVDHLIEHSLDRERRRIWVAEGEVAVLRKIGTVLHCYQIFPALVATEESAVAGRFDVTPTSAVLLVLAWR